MTVLCTNSGITYADIASAIAGESGNVYLDRKEYIQSGMSTAAANFTPVDHPLGFLYTAADGELVTSGDINSGAGTSSVITSTVDDGEITDVRTGALNVLNSNNAKLRRVIVNAGNGSTDGIVFNDTLDAEDVLIHNCNDGFLSSVVRLNSSIVRCTVVGATRFGFAQGKFTDCVDVNSSNQGYFNEAATSSGTWENDGTGTDTITESPATDIFVDYAGGNYSIKADSSPGLSGAGAFIVSATSELNIVGSTPGYSYTVPLANVDLTGELNIVGSTPSYSYTVPLANVDLTGELNIVGSTPSYSYTVPLAVVDLTGELNVVGSTPSYSYTVPLANVDLTGELNIVGSTPSYSYTVPLANVDLTGELNVVGSTPSYSYTVPLAVVDLTGDLSIVGTTPTYFYVAVRGVVSFSGGACLEIKGDITLNSKQFSGHDHKVPVACFESISGSVTIDSFNK